MTPWERGQSSLPPLHLSIFAFMYSPLSLFCGSWYVDFIKFSSEWVTEKTGGDEGSHPLFAAFICLSSFIPARGLWSSGPRGEKVAQVPLPSLDTVLHNNSLIPLRSESGKEIKKKKRIFLSLSSSSCITPRQRCTLF